MTQFLSETKLSDILASRVTFIYRDNGVEVSRRLDAEKPPLTPGAWGRGGDCDFTPTSTKGSEIITHPLDSPPLTLVGDRSVMAENANIKLAMLAKTCHLSRRHFHRLYEEQ